MKYVIYALLVLMLTACSDNDNPVNSDVDKGDDTSSILVNPKTKIIDETTRAAILSIDTTLSLRTRGSRVDTVKELTLNTYKGVPFFDTLSDGDLIVDGISSIAPYGLLRKVSTIDSTSIPGMRSVYTTQATLPEAINRAHKKWEKSDVSPTDIAEIILEEGVTVLPTSSNTRAEMSLFNFQFDKTFVNSNGEVTVKGNTALDIGVFLNFDWDYDLKLSWDFIDIYVELFEAGVSVDQYSSITVESTQGISFTERFKFGTVKLSPFTIMVGPVPLIFYTEIALYIDFNGNVSAQFYTYASERFEGRLGVKYQDSEWGIIAEKNFETKLSGPRITGDASFGVGVGPEVSIMLYGVAGPFANIKGAAQVDATVLNNNQWDLDFYVGCNYQVGVEIDVLGFEKRFATDPAWLFKDTLLSLKSEAFKNEIFITDVSDNATVLYGSIDSIKTTCTGVDPTSLRFYIDNVEIGSLDASSGSLVGASFPWDTKAYSLGSHELKVVEYIGAEEVSRDSVTIQLKKASWTQQDLQMESAHSLYMLDQKVGWISAQKQVLNSSLLKTTDGGSTWNPVVSESMTFPFVRMEYTQEGSGYGIHFFSTNFVRIDNGQFIDFSTAFGEMMPIDFALNGVQKPVLTVRDTLHDFVATLDVDSDIITSLTQLPLSLGSKRVAFYGTTGLVYDIKVSSEAKHKILTSSDDGLTWNTLILDDVPLQSDLNNVHMYSDTEWWFCGVDYGEDWNEITQEGKTSAFILKTVDGGVSWQKIALEEIRSFGAVRFISSKIGYAAVDLPSTLSESKLYKTEDGGVIWTPVPEVSNTSGVLDLSVHGEDNLVALSYNGIVYKLGLE